MSLETLLSGLVDLARAKVRSGQISERRLARECGLSQPHLHNVLHGLRDLSRDSADRLMRALDTSIPELLWRGSVESEKLIRAVPFFKYPIGAGTPPAFTHIRGYVPLPASIVAGAVSPVAARIGSDLALPDAFSIGDLVLLDIAEESRLHPLPSSCWVISTGAGMGIRYVSTRPGKVQFSSSRLSHTPGNVETIHLGSRSILEVILAKVVWLGREMERTEIPEAA